MKPPKVIELRLNSLEALFETQHPNPLRQPEMLDNGMNLIYRKLRSKLPKEGVVLYLFISGTSSTRPSAESVVVAISNYCKYKSEKARSDYLMTLLEGKKALPVGLFFLALCLSLAFLIQEQEIFPYLAKYFVKEGLYIIGWVGMWKPIEIFLFEWWPFYRQVRVYNYMSKMKVVIKELQ